MSVESVAKIANIKSPSDFMRAVMKGSGRSEINKDDVLCALTNHSTRLGQQIMYYWLYEEQRHEAEAEAVAAARGGWLVSTPFMADRKMLADFGRCALSQLMKRQDPKKLIAQINNVTEDAIRKNVDKYDVQLGFLNQLVNVFDSALTQSKREFIKKIFDRAD